MGSMDMGAMDMSADMKGMEMSGMEASTEKPMAMDGMKAEAPMKMEGMADQSTGDGRHEHVWRRDADGHVRDVHGSKRLVRTHHRGNLSYVAFDDGGDDAARHGPGDELSMQVFRSKRIRASV